MLIISAQHFYVLFQSISMHFDAGESMQKKRSAGVKCWQTNVYKQIFVLWLVHGNNEVVLPVFC